MTPASEFDSHTLAVLRGRLVRYLMRSREVSCLLFFKSNVVRHRHRQTIDILYLFMQVKRRQPEADVDLRLQFLMNIELKYLKYLGI